MIEPDDDIGEATITGEFLSDEREYGVPRIRKVYKNLINLRAICEKLGIPYRIFTGVESPIDKDDGMDQPTIIEK